MALPSRPRDAASEPAGETGDAERVRVSTHCTNPDRTVFIEENNSDGWIATSVTVTLDR